MSIISENEKLVDNWGRSFSYLRLSLTEVCNFRCTYCLPNGYCRPQNYQPPLNLTEIKNLTTALSLLGISKIRLTGGEPTLRGDFIKIVDTISQFDRIKKIAVTTNGYALKKLVPSLRDTNLKYINVSIDSLNSRKFYELTGHDTLPTILEAVDEALVHGFFVKTNAVILKENTLDDLEGFLTWIKERPVTVRFIELMQTGLNKQFFENSFLNSEIIINEITRLGFKEVKRELNSGPAREFFHPSYKGKIGIIAPYSKNFCQSCNRLRISATGSLKLCLFGEGDYSLRDYLQNENDIYELIGKFKKILNLKKESHYLQEDNYGDTQSLSAIGG